MESRLWKNARSSGTFSSHKYSRTLIFDWLLNSPRATKLFAVETRSTSSPSAGVPSMRSMAPANTHGCRPKNGCARRALRITLAVDMVPCLGERGA